MALASVAVSADVTIEKVRCLKLPNCERLSNKVVEVNSQDRGWAPRLVRYAFAGEDNPLARLATTNPQRRKSARVNRPCKPKDAASQGEFEVPMRHAR